MKKVFSLVLALVLLSACALPSAYAASSKNLDQTVTSFSLLYRMCYEQLTGKTQDISRKWDEKENRVTVSLGDICFCMFDTESNKDTSLILECLFVAAPETRADRVEAMSSMFSVILCFDPDLGTDLILELVTDILPAKKEYVSAACRYKYVEMANTMMLYISPR